MFARPFKRIEVAHLSEKLGLATVTRVPHLSDTAHVVEAVQGGRSVVSYSNKPLWTKQQDQLEQQFFTSEASRVFRRLLSVRRSCDEPDKEQVFT